jgi:Protein of unknown function (DUF1161)
MPCDHLNMLRFPRSVGTLRPVALALAFVSLPCMANNCEAIRSLVEARIRESGVKQFTVVIVGATDKVHGKTVGTCDRGMKKLVYSQAVGVQGQPGRATLPPRTNAIITECRDGSVSVSGDCKK